MKRVRLTALAEFDLIEAQDFYMRSGNWVVAHFMECLDEAFQSLSGFAGIRNMIGEARTENPHGLTVEGGDAIVHAVLDDRFGPARIAAHFGPLER